MREAARDVAARDRPAQPPGDARRSTRRRRAAPRQTSSSTRCPAWSWPLTPRASRPRSRRGVPVRRAARAGRLRGRGAAPHPSDTRQRQRRGFVPASTAMPSAALSSATLPSAPARQLRRPCRRACRTGARAAPGAADLARVERRPADAARAWRCGWPRRRASKPAACSSCCSSCARQLAARALERALPALPGQATRSGASSRTGGARRSPRAWPRWATASTAAAAGLDGHAPTIRELAIALSHVRPRPARLAPSGRSGCDRCAVAGHRACAVEEYLARQAPDLDLEHGHRLPGSAARRRLAELWDIWGRLRTLLLTPA